MVYSDQVGGTILRGISVGWAQTNNAGDLKEVDVLDITTVVENGTTREVVRTRKALSGSYKTSGQAIVKGDLAWYPPKLGGRILMDFYAHTDPSKDDWRPRLGVGAFLTEPGKPTHLLGGITVSHGDVALFAGASFK